MEILKPDELVEHGITGYAGFLPNTPFFQELLKVELDGALVISYKEWPIGTAPQSTYINKAMESLNHDLRFKMRRLQNGKGYAFIRTH